MKNNYPIKYALIPITKQVGRSHGLNESKKEYGTICYIISKCYLIDEIKKYNINGTCEKKYKVVFPFQEGEYSEWHKEEPSFNLINGQCTNSIQTDNIFDSFDEAKKYKDRKNEDILEQHLVKVAGMVFEKYKIKYKEIKDEFNKILSYYNNLQSEILNNTNNLEINRIPKEQKAIRIRNNTCSNTNSSLYEIIKVCDSINYIVYSITKNEFSEIEGLYVKDDKLKKYNHTPLLINDGHTKTTKVISPSNKYTYLTKNKLSNEIDNHFSIPNKYEEVFYTIEDYNDIINSYENKYDSSKVIKLIKKNLS